MKKLNILVLIALFLFICNNAFAQNHRVRFGFLGNSITIGAGLSTPLEECYPAQLAELLTQKYGDTCEVRNFAVSGRTLLRNGDYPLWDEEDFEKGWEYAPDICFICLGTNDSKPQNWDSYGDEFLSDYLAMIDTFLVRNPDTKFIVSYPPPAYDVVWGIRNSVIYNEIMPLIDSIMSLREAILVDFYHPLVDSAYLFPDKIHPNAAGSKVMAKIAFDRIVETDMVHNETTDHTFVYGFESNKEEIRVKDTAVLSWTTINATNVYINGQAVEANGSLNILPSVTTEYTILAIGDKSRDSSILVQPVYQPELANISIDPYRVTIEQGQSINLVLKYIDQRNNLITDTTFNIAWTIVEGDGTLTSTTDTSAIFNAGELLGKVKVQASHGAISIKSYITVELGNSINNFEQNTFKLFPNPFNEQLSFSSENFKSKVIDVKIFDMLGKLKLSKEFKRGDKNSQTIILNTQHITTGSYIIQINTESACYSRIINKK